MRTAFWLVQSGIRATFLIVPLSILLLWSARDAEAGVVTYLSSTRYIEGNGIPREDAVGFNDFDVSRGAFIGVPGSGLLYARVEAAQTSLLLPDRIEVSTSTLTRFIENPFGNSIGAFSGCLVVFSIDEATEVSLVRGAIQAGAGGGAAGISILNSDGNFVLSASSNDPVQQSAVLSPGTYSFTVISRSGSLQSGSGASTAVATLFVPSPPAFLAFGLSGAVLAGRRREA